MRGFSLIELCACLVILGLLAAFAGPSFFSTQPFDERGYIDELAAALRHGQAVAVASACNVSVTINGVGYSAMQRPASPGNTCVVAGGYTVPVVRSDGTVLAGTAPSDAPLGGAGGTIIFGPAGQVTNAPAPALTVGPFSLTVDPTSGFVTVQ